MARKHPTKMQRVSRADAGISIKCPLLGPRSSSVVSIAFVARSCNQATAAPAQASMPDYGSADRLPGCRRQSPPRRCKTPTPTAAPPPAIPPANASRSLPQIKICCPKIQRACPSAYPNACMTILMWQDTLSVLVATCRGRARVGVSASAADWPKRIRDMQYVDRDDFAAAH